ncbi:endo alpha-1,4 polygalactosaminidase [Baekduia sp. Peel2402]|uniref:endo alpha-1,4 polygalactosaminidase n=1 Tax=Baekduia sp. Peel2402 TaxID=3458296 RepID=UPI00403E6FF5
MSRGAAAALLVLATLTAATLAAATINGVAPRAHARANLVLEGERLRVSAASGRVVRDAAATGRRALLLTGTGTARGRARVTAPARTTLVVRGSACAGAPRIALTIDGTRALTRAVKSARRYTSLSAAATLATGSHAIAVRLLNPHRGAGCRRTVRVDRLVLAPAPASSTTPAAPSTPTATSAPIWRPAPGISWQWQLTGTLDLTVDAALYDVDLFDTSAATVDALHRAGRHVVCYLDAGTYEPGRPDSADYPASVLGAEVEGWPGERWLDIRRLDLLAPIIERRLDLCRDKGFDGVEPDNVDAYANTSGFPLSAADQLAFNRFLAAAAHARGLSAGLKNDLDQAAALEGDFDWALDEQCYQYDECQLLAPFARAGKAVLIAEYELAPEAFCASARAAGYSAIRKRLDLNAWRQTCQ